jgi:hypothetical protein
MLFLLNSTSCYLLSDQDSIQTKALSRYLFRVSLSVDLAEIIDYQVSFYENESNFFATSILFRKREGIQKTDSKHIQIPSSCKIGSDPIRDRIMRAARSEPYHQIIDRHPDHCKGNLIPNENHLSPLPETHFPHRTKGQPPSPAASDAHGVLISTTPGHLAHRVFGRPRRAMQRSNRATMPDNMDQVRFGCSRFPLQRAATSESSFLSHTITIDYQSSHTTTITYYPNRHRTYTSCSDPTRFRIRRPADIRRESVQK